ncbi:MAG TPA: hypothetical protein PLZ84_01755 [Clostridia bacterium]|nr:hypothetical protein [Clostridia bacterium]
MSVSKINGCTVTSYVYDTATGETVPFEPSMAKDVMFSLVKNLSIEDLKALPLAPKGTKIDYIVEIDENGTKYCRKNY